MNNGGPAILALQTDSAWVVVLAVSAVTLPAVLLLRRMIRVHGGAASGVLMLLPLLLPLVAAAAFSAHALLPEVTVLRPVGPSLLERPGELLQFLFVSDGRSGVLMPYTISGTAGVWILLLGGGVSSVMLVRRVAGELLIRRLVARCSVVHRDHPEAHLLDTVERLAQKTRLRRRVPAVLLLPPGISGAFAVGIRRPKILIGNDLLDELDPEEFEGILAHELAHLEARDVQIAFLAGFMRDLVAWNPFAHIAYRKLARQREGEADMRAASLTGRPLALASGLLKVCERIDRRPCMAQRAAVGALSARGVLVRRVSGLIDLSDRGAVALRAGRAPYVMAAFLVAILGLQAGARLRGADPTAFAIVWGAPYASKAEVWAPKTFVDKKPKHKKTSARRFLGHPEKYLEVTGGMALYEKDMTRWIRSLKKVAGKSGLPAAALQWELSPRWRAEPMLVGPGLGPISVLRLKQLDEGPGRPR